jgi:membrane protease YdiL (CAAX protease family)
MIVALAGIAAFCLAMALGHRFNIWLTTGSAATLVLFLALATYRKQLGQHLRPRLRSLLIGLAGGALMVLATQLVFAWLVTMSPWLGKQTAGLYALLAAAPGPLGGLPILLTVVLAEEVIWRGALYDVLEQRLLGAHWVVMASVALYLLPQLFFGSLLLMLVAVIAGAIWTLARVVSKDLLAPLLVHLIWDLATFVVWPLI